MKIRLWETSEGRRVVDGSNKRESSRVQRETRWSSPACRHAPYPTTSSFAPTAILCGTPKGRRWRVCNVHGRSNERRDPGPISRGRPVDRPLSWHPPRHPLASSHLDHQDNQCLLGFALERSSFPPSRGSEFAPNHHHLALKPCRRRSSSSARSARPSSLNTSARPAPFSSPCLSLRPLSPHQLRSRADGPLPAVPSRATRSTKVSSILWEFDMYPLTRPFSAESCSTLPPPPPLEEDASIPASSAGPTPIPEPESTQPEVSTPSAGISPPSEAAPHRALSSLLWPTDSSSEDADLPSGAGDPLNRYEPKPLSRPALLAIGLHFTLFLPSGRSSH